MDLLVTGGTGFVGWHLVPRLTSAGHNVRVLARGMRRAAIPEAATTIRGDVATGEGLAEGMEGVDAVIHLAAVIRERGRYTFRQVNWQGTARVVEVMRRTRVSRMIHMSALGAGPDRRYAYTYSKWQGEEEVRKSGLDYTIFRPSVQFGNGGGLVKSLKESAAFPVFVPVPGSGRSRFQPIWVEDVATCVLLSLERPDSKGQTYELGGPGYLTYAEMLDLVLAAHHLRRIKVPVPMPLMRVAAALFERLLPNPPVTTGELALLAIDNTTALDSVERTFGFPPARMRDKLIELG